MASLVLKKHHQEDSNMKVNTTIRRPELTEQERAKRLEAIKQAAVELVLATEREKERKKAS